MRRKSFTNFIFVLLMIASLIFIGCEAAPENVLQNDLPVVDEPTDTEDVPAVEEPTVPEDPKDKFVGKWIIEGEDGSLILEVSPYGSGLVYNYVDGRLEGAPSGFTYEADGNELSIHVIDLDLSLEEYRYGEQEALSKVWDAVFTFDEESGSLVAENNDVLVSMYKENLDLALDSTVFGKWKIEVENGFPIIEMTPAGYMIYNIGGKSHLAKYSTAEGKLRFNDVEASYSVEDEKLNYSLNGEDIFEFAKIVALDENEIVGSYISPELALNITDNGLFVFVESSSDYYELQIITDITESEIVACYWYDPDEEFVVTTYSYDASGINIDMHGDILTCEKSEPDILVPTLVTGGVGYLDKNETTYIFTVKSIFDQHVNTHDEGCSECEGSLAKYFSAKLGLDESTLKPLDDADNILMYSEFVGDSLVSMLGAYEIDGENIHISFCTEEGVIEKTITLVYVPVSDMFYVVDGDIKTLFVTSGA